MNTFFTMLKTETKLSLRGMDMPFFGVLMPIGLMLLIGSISGGQGVRENFAGVAAVGICAAGLMGIPLTFAGYRHGKILKRFRVSPVSPFMLLAAVGTLQLVFAWVSGFGVYLTAWLAFGMEPPEAPFRYILTFLFVQLAVYSVGFLVASLAPNMKTANLICTVLYFPMLFLSGTTVPFEILPRGLQRVSQIFPLTQGILLLKGAVTGTDMAADTVRFIILGITALIALGISLVFFRWE
ncbi:ABC transporter permease [Breznakiella homolactica]|uniref:ABC transporter permease n=1 Tax=Breznakiella homolactica TaxID=2798577 RepID=A0A7T7XM93_9SPIR|nr:ABC transporter permease [Breznakiella homolactica]QQO08858.1 ABC transporter permease [Breznakiella homolactica]